MYARVSGSWHHLTFLLTCRGRIFFFCGQKGQNNSTLNAVTDKNRKSLPPFSSAFESHQGGNTFPNRIKRTLTTIFFSKSEHEHAQHVFSVLQRLLQNQLFIKAEKFQFHVSEVSFLGLVVTISLPSVFYPQSNGQTERKKQEMETALHYLASGNPSPWSKQLIWVEYAHNPLPSFATGFMPFQCSR